MPTPIVDLILGDILAHDHSEADLGATLDNRFVNVTGDTMTGNLILNDNVSVLLGTGSDGELFHDGSNTYFQNNTGDIIIENDASDGDITFKVNDGGVDKTVMTLDGATGNVGIGTTSPATILHVENASTTPGASMRLLAPNMQIGSNLSFGIGKSVTSGNSAFLVWDNQTIPYLGVETYGGANPFRFWGTQVLVTNANVVPSSSGGLLRVMNSDATTNAVATTLTLGANVTDPGVASTGLGAGILFQAESTTTSNRDQAQIASLWTTATDATRASALTFSTLTAGGALTEKMRIDGVGNVGIGTTSPVTKLDLSYDSAIVSIGARFVNTATSGSTSGAGMVGLSDDGAAMASGDRLGYFLLGGSYDNSHTLTNTAGMSGFATEAWSATNKGTRLAFEGTPTGSATRAEWMTIKDGNVGIGTTSPINKLQVIGKDASGTGNDFIALFQEPGITTEASAILGSASDRSISVQGAGGAFFMGRDITNDIEFLMGTSSLGEAFAGSITAHDMSLRTNNVDRLTVKANSGNVGIGTTSPIGKIDIIGSSYPVIRAERTTTQTGGAFGQTYVGIASGMLLKTTTSGDMTDGFGGGFLFGSGDNTVSSDTNYFARIYGRRDGADDTGAIEFYNGGDSKFSMIIRGSGNVGIGTTSPTQKLEINGNILANYVLASRIMAVDGVTDVLRNDGITNRIYAQSGGMAVTSAATGASLFTVSLAGNISGLAENAATSTVSNVLTFNQRSSGTPTNGFGTRTLYNLETSTSNDQNAGSFDITWTDATHASRTSKFGLSLVNNAGSLTELFSVLGSGNVGIGTTSPSGRLHINGTVDDQQLIVEAHSTQTNNIVEIHDSSSNVLVSFDGVGGAVFNEYGSATADFRVESDTEANMLFVDANANTDGSVYLGGTTNGIEIKKGGDLTLLGTAKYERHVQIPAMLDGKVANQPTSEDFFTAGGLQFASAGAQYAYCQWEIPDDWDGTDIVFEIDWFPDSGAISGTDAIRWTVEYRAIAEGELINQGTSVTVDNGVGGDTTDYAQYETKHSRFTLTYNNANQPLTAQDHVYFKISRDTSVANDFAGTVTVAAYEVIYQSKGLPSSN